MFYSLVWCLCYLFLRSNAASILDVVRTDPQLSSLASLIAGTGGGIPNPGTFAQSPQKLILTAVQDIEERFDSEKTRNGLTLFAPTNDVRSSILTEDDLTTDNVRRSPGSRSLSSPNSLHP